ncbi:hypothetical protein D9M68_925540 [compost metagenome]
MAAFQLTRLGAACLAPCQQGGQRHAAPQALAQGDDVGAHAIELLGQQRTTATNTGLHLIKDQQDAQFAAERFHALEVFLSSGNNARLPLYRLEHDCHGA